MGIRRFANRLKHNMLHDNAVYRASFKMNHTASYFGSAGSVAGEAGSVAEVGTEFAVAESGSA